MTTADGLGAIRMICNNLNAAGFFSSLYKSPHACLHYSCCQRTSRILHLLDDWFAINHFPPVRDLFILPLPLSPEMTKGLFSSSIRSICLLLDLTAELSLHYLTTLNAPNTPKSTPSGPSKLGFSLVPSTSALELSLFITIVLLSGLPLKVHLQQAH